VIRPLGDGKYEVPSPALMRVGERVAALGVPLDMLLSVVEQMDRSNEGVARAFTRLFHECIWKPFEEAGHPEEQWPQVIRAIEELRPLATEALLASFRMKMTEESEKAFEAALAREARRGSRHHRGDRERTSSRLPAPEPLPQT
jgi:hypothetical protein